MAEDFWPCRQKCNKGEWQELEAGSSGRPRCLVQAGRALLGEQQLSSTEQGGFQRQGLPLAPLNAAEVGISAPSSGARPTSRSEKMILMDFFQALLKNL